MIIIYKTDRGTPIRTEENAFGEHHVTATSYPYIMVGMTGFEPAAS